MKIPRPSPRLQGTNAHALDPLQQDIVHHRRVARHRTGDRVARRARRRERGHRRQDFGANPKLPGTIHSAAREIEAAGGRALPLTVDVRDETQVRAALDKTAETFGGIDIVVNNASAISMTNSQATEMKRFDLMHQINARGTFMVSKFAVPFLEKSANAHILSLSPPLDLKEKWFAGSTAYSMAKYGMSLVVLGLAGELRGKGIAVNALWPRTTIATAAIKNLLGGEAMMRASRTPDILSDAAHMIFLKDARQFSGEFLIDDTFLFENGVRDFDRYRVDPSVDLAPDFFVPEELESPGQPREDRGEFNDLLIGIEQAGRASFPPRGGRCHCEAMTDEGDRAERDGSERSTRQLAASSLSCLNFAWPPAHHGAISLRSIPLIRPFGPPSPARGEGASPPSPLISSSASPSSMK